MLGLGWVYFPMTVARARCHQPLRRGRGTSVAAGVDVGAASTAASTRAGAEASTVGSARVAPRARPSTSTSRAAATAAGSAIVVSLGETVSLGGGAGETFASEA